MASDAQEKISPLSYHGAMRQKEPKVLPLPWGLTAETNAAVVGYYLWNNTLAKASIVAYYQKTAE